MRIFHITAERFVEIAALPEQLPAQGFLWLGSARRAELAVPLLSSTNMASLPAPAARRRKTIMSYQEV